MFGDVGCAKRRTADPNETGAAVSDDGDGADFAPAVAREMADDLLQTVPLGIEDDCDDAGLGAGGECLCSGDRSVDEDDPDGVVGSYGWPCFRPVFASFLHGSSPLGFVLVPPKSTPRVAA